VQYHGTWVSVTHRMNTHFNWPSDAGCTTKQIPFHTGAYVTWQPFTIEQPRAPRESVCTQCYDG
jgi:hypothetical protein